MAGIQRQKACNWGVVIALHDCCTQACCRSGRERGGSLSKAAALFASSAAYFFKYDAVSSAFHFPGCCGFYLLKKFRSRVREGTLRCLNMMKRAEDTGQKMFLCERADNLNLSSEVNTVK